MSETRCCCNCRHDIRTGDVVSRESYESMERTVNLLNKALQKSVEVVRCEDCKWWTKDETALRGICDEWSDFEDGISRYTGGDDYCSYGERKEK